MIGKVGQIIDKLIYTYNNVHMEVHFDAYKYCD